MIINLIGYFNYDFGIAKNAKYFQDILTFYNIKYNVLNIDTDAHSKLSTIYSNFNTNIKINNSINIFFTVDCNLLNRYISNKNIFNKTNKNYLFYVLEVEQQINDYINIIKYFDIILVQSEFILNITNKYHNNVILFNLVKLDKPLLKNIPYRNKIICLYCFDNNSCPYRKNLDGIISLIENIDDDRFFFIIKIVNSNNDIYIKFNNLKNKNYILMTNLLSDNDVSELYNISDIYI